MSNQPHELGGPIDVSQVKVTRKEITAADMFVKFGKALQVEDNIDKLIAGFTPEEKDTFNKSARMMMKGFNILGINIMDV